jgi:hypothetical protein
MWWKNKNVVLKKAFIMLNIPAFFTKTRETNCVGIPVYWQQF